MRPSKRTLAMVVGVLVAGILALVGPELYAQGRMVTTTGVVFVRGIIGGLPLTIDNIITTSTDGLLLQNTTAAVVGVPVQYAPRLRLCGTAWKTDATTASQIDCWSVENRPTSAAGATTSALFFTESINGGAYTNRFSVATAGTTSYVPHSVVNASGALFTMNNSGADAGVTGNSYISFQTASSTRWYLGMSAAASTGNFDIYDNIDGYNAISIAKGSGIVRFVKGIAVGTSLAVSATAPTIASGGCTTPAVTWSNGTAALKITIGTTCAGVKTVTLTLPAAANQWSCRFEDQTAPQTYVLSANGTSATAVVVSNYARTTGLAADFADSEVMVGSCTGG